MIEINNDLYFYLHSHNDKLNKLRLKREQYILQVERYEEEYDNLTVYDLEDMADLYGRDLPEIDIEIEKLRNMLNCMLNTIIYKNELISMSNMIKYRNELKIKSIEMMYHPKRVNRLLDLGLISFYEENSFSNL
jgi:hypothetical protein